MGHRLAVPILILMLTGCREDRPEAQIQKAFDRCVQAIEASRPGEVIEVLSPGFSGPEGMTREEARLYLLGLLRQEQVGITVFSSRIEVDGARASQSVELLLTSRTGGSVLPQETSHRTFLLRWERREGAWRLLDVKLTGAPA